MKQSEHFDYIDMAHLIQTPEWRSWIKFQNGRVESLKEKAIKQVADGEAAMASKTVAVIYDIRKQVKMFYMRLDELEKMSKTQQEE